MLGQLADDSNRKTVFRIGANKRILHKELAALCVGHHSIFQCIELVLREIFVYIAPKNFIFTAGFAHDGFVFCRTAGVFARIDEYDAMV